jgi:hypothetical protein
MLRDQRALIDGFERRLYKTWKRPLDLFEMMITACAEAADAVNAQWPWGKSEDQDIVFDVVRRLQARACMVASEILTLLKAGYASAAHARWRSLHELAATALFISAKGRDVAERFLAHEHVEAWRAAQKYQEHCRKLKQQPYSRKVMARLRRSYQAALAHYGKEFKTPYGWAAAALGHPSPTFANIEKAAKLQHLRPYYKMASYPVHATVKTIRFSLSLGDQDLLLTGPSNWGLVEPGHGSAISLGQVTNTLLPLWPTTDSVTCMQVLLLFVDEIGKAFGKAHRELKAKDQRARRRLRQTKRKATTSRAVKTTP